MHPEGIPYCYPQYFRQSSSSPRTPSLSHSSSSLTSSPEPVTPPHISTLAMPFAHHYYPATPGCPKIRTIPLPTISAKLDSLLAYSMRPALSWDLAISPPASPWALSQPATDSHLPHLIIRLPSISTQAIEVTTSSASYVTVQDVLAAIYHTLQQNIPEIEYYYLNSEDREMVVTSYTRRYKCINNSRAREQAKRQGIKRVDLLMGRTTWLGLTESGETDEWILRAS